MQEVTGSIPVISTKKHRIWFRYGAFLFVAYGGNDDHYGLWERLFAVWWGEILGTARYAERCKHRALQIDCNVHSRFQRQHRIILSADTASEVRQMLSQKRR